MPTIAQIKGLINQRDSLITAIISLLEDRIDIAQRSLLDLVITGLVDGLDKEDDIIKNTAANRSRMLLMERIFNQFAKEKGLEVVAAVADGVNKILNFNAEYFSFVSEDVKLAPINDQVKSTVQDWLGLTSRNTVSKGGYLDSLVKDETAKQQIKELLLNATITQKGFYETRQNLKNLVTGTSDKVGLIQSRYSQVVYDQISRIDRTINKMYADKLKLSYFIYSGGLVKDSRPFCIKRNGKVFTTDEVTEFDPPAEGQSVPIGYDPFLQCGGYNCRHHLNPVLKTIAVALRPDLAE